MATISHRIALDPTAAQRVALAKACGVARFTWNWALAEWNRQYEAGGKPTAYKLQAEWNRVKGEKYPWVYESPSSANQRPFINLGEAFQRVFSCDRCGLELDRDLNAATNILTLGLRGCACGPEVGGCSPQAATEPRWYEAGTKTWVTSQ